MARHAGVYAGPAGAISLAAAVRLRQEGLIGRNDLTVCMITGHGLKQPEIQGHDMSLPSLIEPDLESLRRRRDQEHVDVR